MDFESILDWNTFFLKNAYLIARKSKDPRTKIGAILVSDRVSLCGGYNGFPRGVNDNIQERYDPEPKRMLISHSERNLIYNAAKHGIKTDGCSVYTLGSPCVECLIGLIQSGIAAIYFHKQFNDLFYENQNFDKKGLSNRYMDQIEYSKILEEESGIKIISIDSFLNEKCMVNGKIYNI